MMLIHRCTTCQHPQSWHRDRDCSYGACTCSTEKATVNPQPESVPTFEIATGRLITELCSPGDRACSEKTCACDACVSVYSEMVGRSA